MEPFRIVCPSCSSKIVVRHAQLVGQTLPCPKCQSPILVAATVKETAVSAPVESARPHVINSDAITQVDPADWNMDALESSPLPDFVPWAANPSTTEPAPTIVTTTAVGPNTPTSAIGSPTSGKWESKQAVARRNILLLTSITVGGLLIAALAFLAFIRMYGKASDRQTAEATLPKEPVTEPKPDLTETSNANEKEETIEPVSDATLDESKPLESDSVPSETDSNASEAGSNPSPLFPNNDTETPDGAAPQGNLPRPDDTPIVGNADASKTDADNSNTEDNLPPIFQDFQRMFDPPSRSNWDDIGKADRIIENEISIENAEVLLRDEFYPPAIAIPSWPERSERILASIQTKPMPILRCIDWFSKVSNTGITVDWFDMNLAGVPWDEPITIEAQNESLGAILGRILEARGLEVVVDDEGFPHVRPSLEKILAKLGPTTSLDPEQELASFPPEVRDAVVPLVIRLLDLSSCTYFQGKLEWTKDATHYDKARWIASMRNLREALATPQVRKDFPVDAVDFGRPGAWWSLRQRLQLPVPMENIVFEERPVIDMLANAASASKTRLVIDWPAVWEHGFHPNRMSVSVLRGRSLEEISNRYLEDYSLELVPLDSETVLLTTDAVRRSIERVIAIRLDQGINMEDLKTAIRSLVPRGLDQRSRFKLELLPGDDKIALLRVCLPTIAQFRDEELQKALGVTLPAP